MSGEKTIRVRETLYQRLEELAKKQNVSAASLMKKAVEQLMEKEKERLL